MKVLTNEEAIEASYLRVARTIASRMKGSGPRQKLKIARQLLGLTQKEFAEHFGIPFTTVRNWEAESREEPTGPAEVFISLLAADPAAVYKLAEVARTQQQDAPAVQVEPADAKTRRMEVL